MDNYEIFEALRNLRSLVGDSNHGNRIEIVKLINQLIYDIKVLIRQ